jgi:hypothetical protein
MKTLKTLMFAAIAFGAVHPAHAAWVEKIRIPISRAGALNQGSTQIRPALSKVRPDDCQYRLAVGQRRLSLANFDVSEAKSHIADLEVPAELRLGFSEIALRHPRIMLQSNYLLSILVDQDGRAWASATVVSSVIAGRGLAVNVPIAESMLVLQENCSTDAAVSASP